ncbi:hypothetical protein LCGC14_0897550 [marine sediment metagenome]|uniref:Uncharacterized protein n=1 Tax=marine sediment metagenome TaxID=412755 RepID=A0A0F9P2A2_9ZZZZ
MAKNPERETIVNFTEAEDLAQIYTCNRKWINRLEKMGFEATEEDKTGGKTFEIPKSAIALPVIRKTRKLTKAQKEEVAKRFRLAREAKDEAKPKPKTKKVKKAAPVVVEDDEEEEEEEEEETPKKVKKVKKVKKAKPEPEEDDEEEEEEGNGENGEEPEDEEEVVVVQPKKRVKKTAKK